MTAEERREKAVTELSNKCAEAYDFDTTPTNAEADEGSITWTVRAAYDAGRSAALEEAATHFSTEFRPDSDLELSVVIAAIRALITAPQKG